MTIKDLKPTLVWNIFDQITKVPRPSKKEGKIRQYLLDLRLSMVLPWRLMPLATCWWASRLLRGMNSSHVDNARAHGYGVRVNNKDLIFEIDYRAFLDDWQNTRREIFLPTKAVWGGHTLRIERKINAERRKKRLFSLFEQKGNFMGIYQHGR